MAPQEPQDEDAECICARVLLLPCAQRLKAAAEQRAGGWASEGPTWRRLLAVVSGLCLCSAFRLCLSHTHVTQCCLSSQSPPCSPPQPRMQPNAVPAFLTKHLSSRHDLIARPPRAPAWPPDRRDRRQRGGRGAQRCS